MINSIQTLNHNLAQFGRAAANAQRSFSDVEDGRAPVRGIEEVAGGNAGEAGRTPTQTSEDPAAAAARLIASQNSVRAAVNLVRAENETIGTLLDTVG